ncbi:MAG TPA: DUF4082 domain-containing protein [Verrucomicrobiae bacterium]
MTSQTRGVSSRTLAIALLHCLFTGLAWSADAVHHFTWSAIPATQWENEGFSVTLTARDTAGRIRTNFAGAVSLSAMAPGGPSTNMILGSVPHSDYFDFGAFTLGYAFTPNADLLVTHLRHYAGSKVSIWTDGGDLLASQNVTSVPGIWLETPLASPVPLSSGNKYRIAFYVSGTNYYWRNDGPPAFRHGTIDGSYEIMGDSFPASPDSVQWWLVDLRYAVCAAAPVSISPSSVRLANGIWTGLVVASSPMNSLLLRASDGSGHTGDSNPLQVLPASGRRLEIRMTNNHLVFTWPVSAEGFVLERTDGLSWPVQWRPVTNAPASVGSQMVLTNEVAAENGFFRLKR